MRLTIEYGIDLGTTNSAIAVHRRGATFLLPGPNGQQTLPSALYLDHEGRIRVGLDARAAAARDPSRVTTEFKRLMGTDERWTPTEGISMTPEEQSAAVLRELCSWAELDSGSPPRSSVITVPAMFQLPQCDANRRAAELAGIEHVVVLQEPVAAAIAHSGGQGRSDGAWLVYDLGGGTFDVSLVRAKGGRLQVIDHDGNNHLGGRDMDRAIVRLAVSLIREQGLLGEFRRTDPRHADAFVRLKSAAEHLRLRLSEVEEDRFEIDDLDGRGTPFSFPVDRELLESLLEPIIHETTSLCTRVLNRNGISGRELDAVVMVGGPTLTPFLPRRIEEVVGTSASHHVDPMTIVAKGAALFASTQRVPASLGSRAAAVARNAIELCLEYPSMTTDPEPLLVVRAPPDSQIVAIRVQSLQGGRTVGGTMSPEGIAAVELRVEPNRPNSFQLQALGADGRSVEVTPNELDILHGFSIANPPLAQSIGVMLADNTVRWYIRRGAVLPARGHYTHMTTKPLRKGESGDAVNVPLVQGDAQRADRNNVIGMLRIVANGISRDLPAGSEVEVTIAVDESMQTSSTAYVPLLGQSFEDIIMFDMGRTDPGVVKDGIEKQKERLKELGALADSLEEDGGDIDGRLEELDALLDDGDRDSIDVADQMLRTLSIKLDEVEEHGRQDELEHKASIFEQVVAQAHQLGERAESARVIALHEEFGVAIERGDLDLAAEKIEAAHQVYLGLVTMHPEWWRGFFQHLVEQIRALGLEAQAQGSIERGSKALQNNTFNELRGACFELLHLLPRETQEELQAQGLTSHIA